jgi:hypothetical protein
MAQAAFTRVVCSDALEYGGPIAGHLIGQFPHERIAADKVTLHVHPNNPNRMRDLDAEGQQRHWILEIHFVDHARQIAGFYKELLTVDSKRMVGNLRFARVLWRLLLYKFTRTVSDFAAHSVPR